MEKIISISTKWNYDDLYEEARTIEPNMSKREFLDIAQSIETKVNILIRELHEREFGGLFYSHFINKLALSIEKLEEEESKIEKKIIDLEEKQDRLGIKIEECKRG